MTRIENQKSKIENAPGLPLLSTWPRVYAFVLIFFALTVALLLWLTRTFS